MSHSELSDWLSASLRKQKWGNVAMLCFLLFSEKKKCFYFWFPSEDKKQTNRDKNPILRGTWAHFCTLQPVSHSCLVPLVGWLVLAQLEIKFKSQMEIKFIEALSGSQSSREMGHTSLWCWTACWGQSTQQGPSGISQEVLDHHTGAKGGIKVLRTRGHPTANPCRAPCAGTRHTKPLWFSTWVKPFLCQTLFTDSQNHLGWERPPRLSSPTFERFSPSPPSLCHIFSLSQQCSDENGSP